MANLEERVASLEAQADRHALAVDNLRTELRGDMEALRTELRGEMAALRTELRGEMAGQRTDMRASLDEVRASVADLRTDMRELSRRWDKWFLWMAGTQVATLLAVIGVLVGVLSR